MNKKIQKQDREQERYRIIERKPVRPPSRHESPVKALGLDFLADPMSFNKKMNFLK